MSASLDAFLEMLAAERGAAANTLAAYHRDLTDAAAFLKPAALEAADAGDVDRYLRSLADRGFSPRTTARRLSALRQFFRCFQ